MQTGNRMNKSLHSLQEWQNEVVIVRLKFRL
ncbi:hypothetical protein QFZ51_001846 [Chitinophaga sp. W3I9]